jgi:hypothetical protein
MANQPLFPVSLSKSEMILASKGHKVKLSVSFIADFSNGVVKVLNRTKWVDFRLVKESDLMESVMSKDNCRLYFLDWSNNPTFGTWDKNYPN